MKIVILVRILWTAGAQKAAIEEAKTFKDLGHDVKLVFLRKADSGDFYFPLLKGVDWDVMARNPRSIMTPFYDWLTGKFMPDRRGEGRLDYNLIRGFTKYIKFDRPDLIVCHDQWAGLAGYYAFRKLGINYVTILHESLGRYNLPILGTIANSYEKLVLKNSKRVFAINEKIADSAKKMYGLETIVNYHGMDAREKLKYEEKEDLILANTTWDSNRASDLYMEILEGLPEFKMQMVGRWRDANLKSLYKNKIIKHSLESRIEMRENLKEEEIRVLYLKSKFMIRFGYGENGNPHGIIDSLSHGIVPILNSELGISKIIKDFNAGIVVDNIDSELIITRINDINNKETYSKLQKNMNKLCSEYSWLKHCNIILEDI